MESFDRVYRNPFPHEIVATMKGLAGETKSVAVLPDADRLLLFRGYTVKGSDTVGGDGTILREIRILGKQQLRRAGLTSQLDWLFSRGIAFDAVHPRTPVEFVVEFRRDCEWTGMIAGRAIEVANEGVYAITPTVACTRSVPESVYAVSGYWKLRDAMGTRCEHCWFRFGEHATFPWRERSLVVEAEALDAGATRDFPIEFTSGVIPHSATMDDRAERDSFITPGFGRADDLDRGGFLHEPKAKVFDYYSGPQYGQTIYVPNGGKGEIALRVTNRSDKHKPFRARVQVADFIPDGLPQPQYLSSMSVGI